MRRDAFRELVPRAVLAIALAVLACCALGALSPPPGPTAIPAATCSCTRTCSWRPTPNVSIAQQVELGDLLTAASRGGFTIRVAIVASAGRPRGDHPAVAEAGQLRQLPRRRALPRLFAAAAGGDAGRVRLQLAGALGRRRLPGARQDRGQARRHRPGRVGRDGRAGARRRLGRPARPARGRPASRSRRRGQPGGAGSAAAAPPATARPDSRRRPAAARPRPPPSPVSPLGSSPSSRRRRWPSSRVGGWLARRAGLRLASMPATARLLQARSKKRARRLPRLAVPGTWLAGGFVADRGRPDRGARGAHAGGRRGAERQRGGGRGPGGQPRPRPGDVPVHRRARLHPDRPVRPAGVAQLLPGQGGDPRVQRLRVHHRLPADHASR